MEGGGGRRQRGRSTPGRGFVGKREKADRKKRRFAREDKSRRAPAHRDSRAPGRGRRAHLHSSLGLHPDAMYATRSSFVSLLAVAVFASSATAATTREAREEGPDRAAATRNRAESSRRRRSFAAPGGARARGRRARGQHRRRGGARDAPRDGGGEATRGAPRDGGRGATRGLSRRTARDAEWLAKTFAERASEMIAPCDIIARRVTAARWRESHRATTPRKEAKPLSSGSRTFSNPRFLSWLSVREPGRNKQTLVWANTPGFSPRQIFSRSILRHFSRLLRRTPDDASSLGSRPPPPRAQPLSRPPPPRRVSRVPRPRAARGSRVGARCPPARSRGGARARRVSSRSPSEARSRSAARRPPRRPAPPTPAASRTDRAAMPPSPTVRPRAATVPPTARREETDPTPARPDPDAPVAHPPASFVRFSRLGPRPARITSRSVSFVRRPRRPPTLTPSSPLPSRRSTSRLRARVRFPLPPAPNAICLTSRTPPTSAARPRIPSDRTPPENPPPDPPEAPPPSRRARARS